MNRWEYFIDVAYYDMWAVRPVGDRDFNSPRLFHFTNKDEAVLCKELLENSFTALPIGGEK